MNLSDNNNNTEKVKKKKDQEKHEKFVIQDLFLLIFYLIISAIGISLCLTRGENAGIGHMAGIALCLCGIATFKFSKYRAALKEHAGEMIFIVVLFGVSLFTLFAQLR